MNRRQWIIQEFLGKSVHIEVDRPIGYCHKGIVYPDNYGYLPGVLAEDGEEQDVYILGVTEPLSAFDGRVVAVIRRNDDCEDKLVVAPEGILYHQGQIAEAVHFQEQYFCSAVDSLLQKSCGVLPYRIVDNEMEFLIVFESYSQCWSLPKGHMEAGETEEQTALRELLEETGLTANLIGGRSASIEYPISPIAKKQVVFFLGQVDGDPKPRPGEIERFKWIKAEDFADHLFPDTVEACKKLLNQ